MSKRRRRVLVTGACRSGTTTVSRLLRDCGLDVPHEKMGEDGTVSCMFFTPASWYPKSGGRPSHAQDGGFGEYRFNAIVHLVRNPMLAIPSQARHYSRDHLHWIEQIVGIGGDVRPRLVHAAYLWLAVTDRVERMCDVRVRLEKLDGPDWRKLRGALPELPRRPPEIRRMNKASGYMRGPPTSVEKLNEKRRGLGDAVLKRARALGYTKREIEDA